MKKPLESVEIVCDSCNSVFTPQEIVILEEYTKLCGDRVRVIYYRCPICKKFYLIGIHNYTSDKMLKRQQELIKSNQSRVAKGLPVSENKLEQIEKLKCELIDYQDVLLERYKQDIDLLDLLLK